MDFHHGPAALTDAVPPFLLEPSYALAQLQRRGDLLGLQMATLRKLIARSFVLVDAADDLDWERPGHGTILVAQDRSVLRSIAAEILQGLGYNVIFTDRRLSVLPEEIAVEAILLDVPLMNEEHFVSVRRAGKISPRIVAATSLPEGPARQHLREAGVVGFVTKPFDPREIARCLQEVLSRTKAAACSS